MACRTTSERELRDLEWVYRPSIMGELIGRLLAPRMLYEMAEKAEGTGQSGGAALCRALAAREKFYRLKKAELEALIAHTDS